MVKSIYILIQKSMTDQETQQQDVINKVYEYAAALMVKEKKSAYETKQALIAKGLDNEIATIVVDNLEKKIHDAKKERANKDMLYGGLWFIGGSVVTAVTYGAASGGCSYVVAWGAILFGAIQFIKGLVNSGS